MNKTIATQFLACIFLISIQNAFSQEALDYTGEVEKMVTLPSSPEASAFEKYGNTDVSLYTGTPNISIPIHQIAGREMSLPMSLSYDASGVKVEQQATWVGLGWNLNVGGRISRVANGLPDDYMSESSSYETFHNTTNRSLWLSYLNFNSNPVFNTMQDGLDYFDFLKDINENKIDAQPDYFSINVPGLSDYIVFDYEATTPYPRALKNPRLKVEYTDSTTDGIESWTITGEDGTIYHFGSAQTYNNDINNTSNTINTSDSKELTYQVIDNTSGNDGVEFRKYINSWLLTKIESPNKKDEFEFLYTSSGFWEQPFPAANIGHVSHYLDESSQNNTYAIGSGNYNQTSSIHRIEQEFLTTIKHNSKTMVSTVLKNRTDIALTDFSALDEIRIHDYNSSIPNPQYLKRVTFNHSYFGNPSSNAPTIDHRLKLDNLHINSGNETTYQTYSFDYEQPANLPSKESKSQDYIGYYNGKSNAVLYPKYAVGGDIYDGADLSPDISKAKIGLLTTIHYPTKGYTEFVYEANTTKQQGVSSQTGTVATEEVSYAGPTTLNGGTAPDPPGNPYCGSDCHDEYQGVDPAYDLIEFQVPETGVYTLVYSRNGTANAEAIFVKGAFNYEIGDYIPPENYVWIGNGSSDNTPVFLVGNTDYSILLVNDTVGSSSTIRVFRLEDVSSNGGGSSQNFTRAGIRVQSIKDYTASGELALQKNYIYQENISGSVSSGIAIYDPQLSYITKPSQPNATDGTVEIREILNRVAGGSGGQQSHVVYHTVYEIFKDTDDPQLSLDTRYKKYQFYTGTDGISSAGAPPFYNQFTSKFEAGKENQVTVKDENDNTLMQTKNIYEDFFRFSTRGIALETKANLQHKYVHIFKDGSTYKYDLVDPVWSGYGGAQIGQGTANASTPSVCGLQDNICINNGQSATYNLRETIASSSFGAPVSSTVTEHFGAENVEKQTQMSYDTNPQNHYVLREQSTTNSLGESLKTKFYYPHDNIVTGSTELVNANRLNEVVKTESLENDIVMSSRETDYDPALNAGVIMPYQISTQKGDDAQDMEERIHFEFYDNGNLKEAKMVDGSITSYIWGYNDMYPIAKVENASYSDVSSLVSNLQTLSVSDNDRTLNYNGNEGALRLALDDIRSNANLTNSIITTYTYDPMVGVTSITDPKGYTTYFEYDEFNRLKQVKDAEGNILSNNEYHYKDQ